MAGKSRRPNAPSAAGETDGMRRTTDADGLGAEAPGEPANAKAAYSPPHLIRYGRLADLTATAKPKGMADMAGRKTGYS